MKFIELLFVQFIAFIGLVFLSATSSYSQAASVSDLLLTEIMANPLSVSDANGEWLELFNPTSDSIDLSGVTLSDISSAGHIISDNSNLFVKPGDYFVLARNGDTTANGGFNADYVYGSGFSLSNSSDEIIFSDTTGELLRLDYGSGFAPAGKSMELIDAVILQSNYAASTSQFGLGDWGTPGEAGSFTFEKTSPTPVPLPGAAWLMGSGLAGLVGFSRQRKHRF